MSTSKPAGQDVARPPFPFFVGCGRSGTSLLRAIFDSSSAMNVPYDTHFILYLAKRRKRYERANGFAIDAFVEDLASQYDFKRWVIGIDDIRGDLNARPPADYADAIRRIFRLSAEREGKPRYGNKSPVHVREIGTLAGLFPDGRFVHILRDGRDVALSYLNVAFGPSTVEAAALRWKRHVTSGRRAGAGIGEARYREVSYEALLDEPERTTRELCAFLEVPFEDSMLRYYERTAELHAGADTPKHHRNLNLPPTKGLRDWRQEMTPEDVRTFETIAGDVLSELGYERRYPRASLAARVGVGTRITAEAARRGWRMARGRNRLTGKPRVKGPR
ncbi:MAG: sulfotransferase family protein [Actinomycetota bacterium]